MSVVGDVRTVMQDFLATELRELKAGMEAHEKRLDAIDGRLEKVRNETDSNLKISERKRCSVLEKYKLPSRNFETT